MVDASTNHKCTAALKAATRTLCRGVAASCKELAADWPETGGDTRERCKHSGSCVSTIEFKIKHETLMVTGAKHPKNQ